MVSHNAALRQDLLEIAIEYGVPDIEEGRMQDDLLRELGSFERNHRANLIDKSRWLIDHPPKVCDRTVRPAYDDTVTGNSLVSVPHQIKAMDRCAVVDEYTAAFHGVEGLVTIPLEPTIPLEVHAITKGVDVSKVSIRIFVKEVRKLLRAW